jgi:4-amino-4-deoxy-L-arabinose transferase-like glycosyltransferase
MTRSALRWAAGVVAGSLVVRLLMTVWLALTDLTESRYATIALHMQRTGDWITPRVWFDGTLLPFWGKPPLHFWLTAASFSLLGASEWTARLPGLLAGAATLAVVFAFARRAWDLRVAAVATTVLASSLLFFVLTGVSTTDMTLTCAVTAALAAFARTVDCEGLRARRWWGVALAASLAAGSLVKGPIAVVIPGASIFLWLALTRRWRLLARVPWLTVIGVFVVVTVPWYLLAERATPGFLRYFLINEHVLRYIKPEYGDLYGSGNVRPRGTIWAFLIAGALPWSGLAVAGLIRSFRAARQATGKADPWLSYALLWAATPALFFTLARQIEPSYPLPGLPGLALATGAALVGWMDSGSRRRLAKALAAHLLGIAAVLGGIAWLGVAHHAQARVVTAIVVSAVVVLALLRRCWVRNDPVALTGALGIAAVLLVAAAVTLYRPAIEDDYSAKTIVSRLAADAATAGRTPVFPLGTPYSASFYAEVAGGPAVEQHRGRGPAYLDARLRSGDRHEVFILKARDWAELDAALRDRLKVVLRTDHWVACVPAS